MRRLHLFAALVSLAAPALSQQFVNASANLPPLGGATESAKFSDWDLDGDLDLVYANGGDAGMQPSRLLVNAPSPLGISTSNGLRMTFLP